jgi:malonyl-CoA O-methyltransferase
LTALDWAMPMLNRVPGKLGWRRRVGRVCADARRLPLADRSLDLVVSNQLLQWLDDPRELFEPLAAAIKPDGLFLFSTLGPDTLSELRHSWAEVDDRPHVHRFLDMHDLGDMLLRSGFKDPVVDVERVTLTYADVGALIRELRALGGSNVAMDRRRQLTGRHRYHGMLECYERFRTDGRIPATWEVIYGLAWGLPEGRPSGAAAGNVATVSVDSLRGSRPPSGDDSTGEIQDPTQSFLGIVL